MSASNKAMCKWKQCMTKLKTIISGKRVDYSLNGLGINLLYNWNKVN